MGSTFHALPFHRSASGTVAPFTLGRTLPTAMQLFGVTHDTPTSVLRIAPRFTGPLLTVHFLPFQRSMSGSTMPFALTKLPTAMHAVAVRTARHDTASRKLWFVPPGAAIGATAHLVPAASACAVQSVSVETTTRTSARAWRDLPYRERMRGSPLADT